MCPKGCGAYLRAAAAWLQGHRTDAAFSPSPRLRANAVSLNPSQAAATALHEAHKREAGEEGWRKIREQRFVIYVVQVP